MKKIILVLSLAGFLIGGSFSGAQAQETKATFSLNLGVQTNLFSESSFDNAWFTLDARAGIGIGRTLEISPEIMAAVDDGLDFDAVWLYPGLMLNLRFGNFFIGAGAALPVIVAQGESDSANLSPKFNLGYRAGHFNLTAYILIWNEEYADFLDVNLIGVTMGYRF